ncbi:glycosyltransferase family 2 protein [Micromonospora sediminimaris]|uniref:Glycosyl transferase n=1 Tax=Micromonospora sediminimaris TaxID=547162 RepID=A0A9W5US23_9ACTN|nr:glycosyltransferase family 2 protein [Micromonospora sediminimaris]GIJ32250.1 glycosyl transferase [Micromonospora sediminimaris]SFC63590.1 Glycosyl transferase family 2 [Micromonospora sediminimaris]
MPSTPEVSVVIPTFARPELVSRAVRSALAQTVTDIEVIVVVDGPDEETGKALAEIGDPRLRVVELPGKGGAPNARNTGVREARAPWTALLDDDDEWLPSKLAAQLELARSATVGSPIIASRLINKTPRAQFVMPRRLPEPGEPICEYLTLRRGLFHGDGFIQTSTIMAPTELLRRVPFTVGLRRQQELDWTVRATSHPDVELLIAAEPLVLWHQDEDRPRISLSSPWEAQLEWLHGIRPLITPRAYAAITMSIISSMAAPTRSFRVFRLLLAEARRHGRPGLVDYLTFMQIWLLPPQLRHRVRDRILGRHQRGGPASTGEPASTGPGVDAGVRAPDGAGVGAAGIAGTSTGTAGTAGAAGVGADVRR